MALINCKEPGCVHQLNTTLACLDVASLIALRNFLSEQSESLPFIAKSKNEVKRHLDYINSKLEVYKTAQNKSIAKVRELYLTCVLGHSYYYEVDCSIKQ